jgi:hypothetical protein
VNAHRQGFLPTSEPVTEAPPLAAGWDDQKVETERIEQLKGLFRRGDFLDRCVRQRFWGHAFLDEDQYSPMLPPDGSGCQWIALPPFGRFLEGKSRILAGFRTALDYAGWEIGGRGRN